MLGFTLTALKWSLSIGNKFFKVVPGMTLVIVLVTLFSQVSVLLAFLLPLKILMLLGSDRVPGYFPSFLASYDHDQLVFFLSFLAIAFYMFYLIAEKAISIFSIRGARLLLERSQKITLFENQEEVASKAYQRYSRSVAAGFFLLLVALVLAWLYPALLLALVTYILIAFAILAFCYSRGGSIKKSLEENTGQVISVATNFGFLASFGFLIWDFLFESPPGILVAIISIILMRQGFSRILNLVNDVKGLYTQRLRLNALFFHGHVLISETKKHETSFWSLLENPRREQWVKQVLEEVIQYPIKRVDIFWWQLAGADVAAFHVHCFNEADAKFGEYFVKLFNVNRGSLAQHEATLLTSANHLPALELLGVEQVEGLHCHVFSWQPVEKSTPTHLHEANLAILKSLLLVEPDKKLVSQFRRSRPLIWQRIDTVMVERLQIVAEMVGVEYVDHMKDFNEKVNAVKQRLSCLPLVFSNPDKGVDAFMKDETGQWLMLNWGRWSLEPVGSGWPTQSKHLENLAGALGEASHTRQSLGDVDAKDAQMAALVSAMEKSCQRQDFMTALEFVPRILSHLESTVETTEKQQRLA